VGRDSANWFRNRFICFYGFSNWSSNQNAGLVTNQRDSINSKTNLHVRYFQMDPCKDIPKGACALKMGFRIGSEVNIKSSLGTYWVDWFQSCDRVRQFLKDQSIQILKWHDPMIVEYLEWFFELSIDTNQCFDQATKNCILRLLP